MTEGTPATFLESGPLLPPGLEDRASSPLRRRTSKPRPSRKERLSVFLSGAFLRRPR